MLRWVLIVMAVAFPLAAAEPGVKVEDPWVRITFGQSRATAGYMTLVDQSGKGNALIGLEMEGGARAEIHETVMGADVVKMRMIKTMEIPAGGRAELTPTGGHIMIMGLGGPLKAGEKLPITLKFADGSKLTVNFEVRGK